MQLYNATRPKRFEDLVGDDAQQLARVIKATLSNPRFQQDAIMLVGESGSGKTTIAQIIARMFAPPCTCETDSHEKLCNIRVVDAGGREQRGIEFAEEWKRDLHQRNLYGFKNSWRIWLIEEAHALSSAAQDSMLRPLENLPNRTLVIATTTHPKAFTKAFLSRWKIYWLQPAKVEDMAERMIWIAANEGVNLDPSTAYKLAQDAEGNWRSALNDCETAIEDIRARSAMR